MLELLLPHGFFDSLSQLVLLLITAGGILAVMKGADWLVEGAAGLAYKLGMAKVVIGATVVSLGTTSPEAAVSVLAAWEGNPGLALGNGVGSIIADTGLIFGVGCLCCALPADKFVLRRQGWVQFGSGVLLAGLCYLYYAWSGSEAELGRWVGVAFLGLLGVYLYFSVQWSRAHPLGGGAVSAQGAGEADAKADAAAVDEETSASIREDLAVWQLIGLGLLGLAVVIVGGEFLVKSASELAMRWGVPDAVVASTLVAFGTSLPELVVGLTSIRKGHPELLVGNVVGADILNVLFVVGAASVAAPLQIMPSTPQGPDTSILQLLLPTMLLMLVLFRLFIFRSVPRGAFSRWMGAPLLVIYVAYVIVQYATSARPMPGLNV